MTRDQSLVTSDQFLLPLDQFEMSDDQNWSPNLPTETSKEKKKKKWLKKLSEIFTFFYGKLRNFT
jgi:hypothetical protein